MPLFICKDCGCVENWHLINKKQANTKYEGKTEKDEKFYPFMDLIDMRGMGPNIILNGEIWKRDKEVKMLCSECNTGEWHDEFTKRYPTTEDSEIAEYSIYNAITPFDHERISLIDSRETISGYKIHPEYKKIHELYLKMVPGKSKIDKLRDCENFLYVLFHVFKNESHFKLSEIETDWNDFHSSVKTILSSVNGSETEFCKNLKYLSGLYGLDLAYQFGSSDPDFKVKPSDLLLLKSIKPPRTKHWKESQTLEEKNLKLKLAQEKRERKAARRLNGSENPKQRSN